MSEKHTVPEAAAEAVHEYAKSAPQWLTVVLIVSGFLVYLYFHERNFTERDQAMQRQVDQVSQMRIDQCHEIQHASIEALQQVTEISKEQIISFDRLRSAIVELERTIREARRMPND